MTTALIILNYLSILDFLSTDTEIHNAHCYITRITIERGEEND